MAVQVCLNEEPRLTSKRQKIYEGRSDLETSFGISKTKDDSTYKNNAFIFVSTYSFYVLVHIYIFISLIAFRGLELPKADYCRHGV